MSAPPLRVVTYVGGPTALLDIDGVRLLTDPTFDPAGSEHRAPVERAFADADLGDRLR